MSPLRGLHRLTGFFPKADALGYRDVAAPRLSPSYDPAIPGFPRGTSRLGRSRSPRAGGRRRRAGGPSVRDPRLAVRGHRPTTRYAGLTVRRAARRHTVNAADAL